MLVLETWQNTWWKVSRKGRNDSRKCEPLVYNLNLIKEGRLETFYWAGESDGNSPMLFVCRVDPFIGRYAGLAYHICFDLSDQEALYVECWYWMLAELLAHTSACTIDSICRGCPKGLKNIGWILEMTPSHEMVYDIWNQDLSTAGNSTRHCLPVPWNKTM